MTANKPNRSKRSAAIVGISVMCSRLMGLVREQIFAFMFGASVYADAFVAAFRIPNLLRDLFAEGALSTAFTTTFTKMWTRDGAEASWRLAQLVLSTLILILGAICVLGIIASPWVVTVISGGFENVPGKFELTVRLTRILFPFILFVSIAAVVMGMLNSRNIFGIPASASTVFNLVSIVSGLIFALAFSALETPGFNWSHPHFGEWAVYGWCLGVLIGGLAQLGMQLPSLWRLGFRFPWRIDFRDPALQTVLMLMIPSAIAGSAVQVNVLVNSQFASHIPGAVSWLYYAFRLVQLPIGIFGVAIATVTLPAVARQHALDDLKAFGKTVEEALRFGFYLTLPASVGLAVVAQPVIALIYQHGRFTHLATAQTALALQAYTIGLAGSSGIKILVPCFYAMQPPPAQRPAAAGSGKTAPGTTGLGPTRTGAPEPNLSSGFHDFIINFVLFTPARVSLIGIALNALLCAILFFYFHLGHVGLALATGFVAIFNFLQLLHAIQKKIDLGRVEDWISFFLRVTAATAALGLVAWAGNQYVLSQFAPNGLLAGLLLFLDIALAAASYFGLTTLLRLPESLELAAFLKRKFGVKY
jgi:putative peptidoglycan lipid II flippase